MRNPDRRRLEAFRLMISGPRGDGLSDDTAALEVG